MVCLGFKLATARSPLVAAVEVTLASGSLTGLPHVHAQMGLPLDFVRHISCPSFYRCSEDSGFGLRLFAALRALQVMDATVSRRPTSCSAWPGSWRKRSLPRALTRRSRSRHPFCHVDVPRSCHGAPQVAAFFAEPLQGAGGVILPRLDAQPARLKRSIVHVGRGICQANGLFPGDARGLREAGHSGRVKMGSRMSPRSRYDVAMVGDEVITGFGRTGHMWGCTAFQQTVDFLSCAKQLTSGYVPLSVTRT